MGAAGAWEAGQQEALWNPDRAPFSGQDERVRYHTGPAKDAVTPNALWLQVGKHLRSGEWASLCVQEYGMQYENIGWPIVCQNNVEGLKPLIKGPA